MRMEKFPSQGVSLPARPPYIAWLAVDYDPLPAPPPEPRMDHALLIASSHAGGHGPQMHGPIVVILLALAFVGGLVFLVRRLRRPKDSDRDPVTGSDRDPVGDRDVGRRAPSDRRSG
jgi:hypothetical protein